MEGKQQLDELLISFLLNELNEEEQLIVKEWISSDEKNQVYLDELKTVLKLVDIKQLSEKINPDEEWKRFERSRQEKQQQVVFLDSEKYSNEVIREVELKRESNVYKTIAFVAVAACIILAIGLGWSLQTRDANVKNALADAQTNNTPPAVIPVIRELTNNTGTTKKYVLQDGTTVLLYSKSEIKFREPFVDERRDIHLSGKAEFNVAKDRLRPFTVFSGNLATRAVGTRFTVTSYNDENKITVRLFEGKVRVKTLQQVNQKTKKGVCLSPGQELVYDKQKEKSIVWAFNKSKKLPVSSNSRATENEVADENPSIPRYGKGSWYMFNNEPLSQVLNELSGMYNAEIIYSQKDISKIYFIGTFNKSDSLESILKQIAQINDLKLLRENNRFTISKK